MLSRRDILQMITGVVGGGFFSNNLVQSAVKEGISSLKKPQGVLAGKTIVLDSCFDTINGDPEEFKASLLFSRHVRRHLENVGATVRYTMAGWRFGYSKDLLQFEHNNREELLLEDCYEFDNASPADPGFYHHLLHARALWADKEYLGGVGAALFLSIAYRTPHKKERRGPIVYVANEGLSRPFSFLSNDLGVLVASNMSASGYPLAFNLPPKISTEYCVLSLATKSCPAVLLNVDALDKKGRSQVYDWYAMDKKAKSVASGVTQFLVKHSLTITGYLGSYRAGSSKFSNKLFK